MCGISGIINLDDSKVIKKQLVAMTDVIMHRGPDGEGFYINHNVGFGHRRLSIIDLSDNASQPMEKDDLIITFNGEIYNYLEVKAELISKGEIFKTNSDTEVILKSYKNWGKSCVDKFNGMWAFAIYDKSRNEIFISRDRFGIKPLYYFKTDNQLVFSSEIKQILTIQKTNTVNKQVLYDFLFLSYHHHNNDTFYENIHSLPQGHNLILDLKDLKLEKERYYDLSNVSVNNDLKLENSVIKYQKLFEDSVLLRLRSDVKVGTCLSGGLDSSYLAKIASENYNSEINFTAITAKSIDKNNDESHFAKLVADKFGLNWKTVSPTFNDFKSDLEKVIYYQEEPFASPSIILQYFVMKKAKEENCKVMLDGQGGDETLLGYERYFIPYLRTIKNPISRLLEMKRISNNSKLSLIQLIKYYVYFSNIKIKEQVIRKRSKYILSENFKFLDKNLLCDFVKSSDSILSMQKKELFELQLPKLLKFEDRNSMANSIEARVPFIDYKLVEYALKVPFKYKIRKGWSKYILRKSYGEVGLKEIIWRKDKYGFEAPTKKWLKDKEYFVTAIRKSEFLDNVIDKNYPIESLPLNTIWRLYNIAIWSGMFNVKY